MSAAATWSGAQVARKVARRYAQRIWWADRDELEQEARTVALEVERRGTWSPRIGVPFSAYVWRACVLGLRSYCLRNSSPVSEKRWCLENLKGVTRDRVDPNHRNDSHPAEEYETAEWRDNARRQIMAVLLDANEEIADVAITIRVLLDDVSPRRAADDAGIDREHVYEVLARARRRLSRNAMLFHMWRER